MRRRGWQSRPWGWEAVKCGAGLTVAVLLMAWSWSFWTSPDFLSRILDPVGSDGSAVTFHVAPSTWLIAIGLGLLSGVLVLTCEALE